MELEKYANFDGTNSAEEEQALILDEILFRIVSYLPIAQWSQLELVSRQFRRVTLLSYHSLKSLDFANDLFLNYDSFLKNRSNENKNLIFTSVLTKLTTYCLSLKKLTGFRWRMEITNGNLAVLSGLNNLTHLSIQEWQNVENVAFSNFLKNNSNLTHLEIVRCKFVHRVKMFDFDKDFDFFGNFANLTSLIFKNMGRVFGRLLFSVVNAGNLKNFDFTHSECESNVLCQLLTQCSNLETLALSSEPEQHENQEIGVNVAVLLCLPHLQRLQTFSFWTENDIDDCQFTIDDLLGNLCQCKNLEEVNFDGSSSLYNNHFLNRFIFTCPPRLQTLSLPPLYYVSHNLPCKLTNLRGLHRLTVKPISKPSDWTRFVTSLPKLENLQSLTIEVEAYTGLNEWKFEILKDLKNLEDLRISNAFSDNLLRFWGENKLLSQLTALELNNFFGWNHSCASCITDEGGKHIAKYGQNLVYLSLKCAKITDSTLYLLAENCKMLENINLSWCINITEKGVLALVSSCIRLHHLKIETNLWEKIDWKDKSFAPFKYFAKSSRDID